MRDPSTSPDATELACAVVGILLLLGGNGLVSVGERSVPSGLASLLVTTVPLWLVVPSVPRVDGLVAGLAYLIGPGSILALSAYSVAVRRLPTSTVATDPYVNPVTAVILGATLLNERLTPSMLIGGALIIVAVALVVRHGPAPRCPRPLSVPVLPTFVRARVPARAA